MPYTIATRDLGETVVQLDGVPAYVVSREARGEAFVLLGCRFGEPRPTVLARNRVADYLVDLAAQNLRAAGHVPVVKGGILIWLDRAENGVDQTALGILYCRSSGRRLSSCSLQRLNLRLAEQRPAKLSERMDAGDASFHPEAQVVFIPAGV